MKPVSRVEGKYIHTIYPTAREVVVRNGVETVITYGDPEFDARHPWPPPGFTRNYEEVPVNEEQVNLQAIRQYVEQHADRVHIERVAQQLRNDLAQGGEIVRIAIALVGAELAAQP